jgi:glycine hydroxymethyltransferase
LTNKYAEGYPGKRYYGGCEVVDEVERLAIERAKKLFGAAWANVQPHSGSSANLAVYYALLSPGDTVLGMDLAHGGHLTHGSPVNFSGMNYQVVGYPVDPETERIDMDTVRELAKEHRPKLIICGASAYSRPIDFAAFRAVADEVGALLMADIAHIAGLVAAKLHPDPVPHAHVVTSTTHKTLRGPRSGIILSNDVEIGKKIDKMIIPGTQGGPLEHVVAGKAVAFFERCNPSFRGLTPRRSSLTLRASPTRSSSGATASCRAAPTTTASCSTCAPELTGNKASKLLDAASITVSKSMIPFDPEKTFGSRRDSSGTPALTLRGFTPDTMPQIAELIDRTLKGEDAAVIAREVKALTADYPMP